MPPPNNPSVCRVAMVFSRDTRQFVNTFHIQRSAVWTNAAMMAAAQIFSDWWNTSYKNISWLGVSLTQVQVRLYDPTNPLAYDLTLTTPIPGSINTPPATANATLAASWRTGLAGRKHRGRFYTVGLTEANAADNDTVTSPYVLALGNAAVALLNALAAQTIGAVIFHRNTNTTTLIITTIIESLIDSQRRRLAGRGR